jgi:hypothetical protein
MTWVIPWSRRSARIEQVDDQDKEHMMNGFICDAAIRALTMSGPACGAPYEIKACDRRSRVFDREKRRFRCSRCRCTAPVYATVDVGVPRRADKSA